MFHSSKTRTCFINGQKEDFIDSGDLIELNNKDIYIIGRNNRSIKINGKLTDLYLLENVILYYLIKQNINKNNIH